MYNSVSQLRLFPTLNECAVSEVLRFINLIVLWQRTCELWWKAKTNWNFLKKSLLCESTLSNQLYWLLIYLLYYFSLYKWCLKEQRSISLSPIAYLLKLRDIKDISLLCLMVMQLLQSWVWACLCPMVQKKMKKGSWNLFGLKELIVFSSGHCNIRKTSY